MEEVVDRRRELIKRAKRHEKISLKMHSFYKGKIEIFPKCRIKRHDDFAVWYTPGVAVPSKAIARNKELSFSYTNRWNSIAVISDGSRVLGLGDIGPEAALPVMEGKALLFKYLGGIDAIPLCVRSDSPKDFIGLVKSLEPSFGGINIEDISQPKCFGILDSLRRECSIPVWHDDQQGTAAVTLAALINALKVVKKNIRDIRVAMIGAGAANIRIAHLIIKAGVRAGNIIMCDSSGALNKDRSELRKTHREKWNLCKITNSMGFKGGVRDVIKGADVLIALSSPGPGVIKKEWIAAMEKDAIVFACANPVPEIWPWDAVAGGARIVATGRSDFPNQVNNSLGFPGIFRGALDVRAGTISDEMCIAAAFEIAKCAEDKGLHEEYIIPGMEEKEVFPREAVAVGLKAIDQGIARLNLTRGQIYNKASGMINRARDVMRILMKEDIIRDI